MMKRSIGTFEIDGLTIEYSRVGEGKPILYHHAFPCRVWPDIERNRGQFGTCLLLLYETA